MHYSLPNTVFFNHNLDRQVYQYNYALVEFKDNILFPLGLPKFAFDYFTFLCLQFVVDNFNKSIDYLAVYFVLFIILAIQTFQKENCKYIVNVLLKRLNELVT